MMGDVTPDRREPSEAVIVTLTRMEGVLNGVADKVGDLTGRTTAVEKLARESESRIQTLEQEAKAEEAKKIALALALKEADETRRNKAETAWTPLNRFLATCVGFAVLGSMYLALFR